MAPPNVPQLVKALHATYEARTGYKLALNMVRERAWYDWLKWSEFTWTETELARVIGYLRRKIGKGERNDGALKFSNLIEQPDRFEEDLNLALEESKNTFAGRARPQAAAKPAAEAEEAPMDAQEAARRWREQMTGGAA
jgi:hypothetical protein